MTIRWSGLVYSEERGEGVRCKAELLYSRLYVGPRDDKKNIQRWWKESEGRMTMEGVVQTRTRSLWMDI